MEVLVKYVAKHFGATCF